MFSGAPPFYHIFTILIVIEGWYISNKYWLLNKFVKNIFTHINLHSSFISKKKKKSTFNHLLLVLTMVELCNDSDKYQFLNKSGNHFFFYVIDLTFVLYFQKLLILSFVEVFKTIHFLYMFGVEVCNISDVHHLLICQPNIDIFTQENWYLRPSFLKKFGALHRKWLSKHLLFPKFILFFTSVRCVIFEINSDFLLSQRS